MIAQNVAATVTDYIHSTASLLQLTAIPAVGNTGETSRSFTAFMAQQPDVVAVRVTDARGKVVYEERRVPGGSRVRESVKDGCRHSWIPAAIPAFWSNG